MSMLTEELNKCDNCGNTFTVYAGGLSGTVDGSIRDYCPSCVTKMDVTNCGDCGELMDWGSLNDDYQCSSCETKPFCPYGIDADECSTFRERSVAGISMFVPDCPVHGPFQDGSVVCDACGARYVIVSKLTKEVCF